MNIAEQILVVFLSTALAIFLVLAIIIAFQVIRLMKTLREISEKAREFVDSAEKTADVVRSAMGQLSIMKMLGSVVELVQKHAKKK